MSETDSADTVLAWLVRAGVDRDRALRHLASDYVRVDDVVVNDPDTPVPPGKPPVVKPGG
jgi:hypothetical protein